MEVPTALYLALVMLVVVLMIVPVQAEAIIFIGLLNDAGAAVVVVAVVVVAVVVVASTRGLSPAQAPEAVGDA